ncbi:MAG: putative dioxygenase [Rhizobium sp.]|nr:putative dioxygenase [Rhizobium sp.]
MSPAPTALDFSEVNSADIFAQRLASNRQKPLPQILTAAVQHLHELIREFRPTPEEWRDVIAFLTEVGHACDERRQEWVLLSDLLGASALVEEINSRRPKGATPNTVRGPFYRADAPHLPLGASISLDGVGEPLTVSARVQDLDGQPVTNATIETWQANAHGFYENQQPDRQPEFNLRGIFRSDKNGRIHYRTIKPAGYSVPDDGPVGMLMKQAGYPLRRPAHLHFMIKAPGFETITTHIFDRKDTHLNEDAIFGVKQELVLDFQAVEIGEWQADFTFTMARSKAGARA